MNAHVFFPLVIDADLHPKASDYVHMIPRKEVPHGGPEFHAYISRTLMFKNPDPIWQFINRAHLMSIEEIVKAQREMQFIYRSPTE